MASPPPTPEKSADRERHFRELLDLTQATLGATHANCISQLRQLAMLLVEEQRWEEAEAELRLLVQRSRQCHGNEHDRTLHALSVHAGVLWRLERSDEARASLEELVAAREAEVQQSAWAIADDDASQQLGRAEEALADALTDLASVLFEGGDAKSAIPLLRRARELLAKLYGEGDEQAVACADMLGRALGAEGGVGGATEACRASIRHKEELYGTDSVEVADAHNELSVLLQQTGDVEKAEVEARAAFELYLKLYGELHAFTATALNNWALLLQARRRRRQSRRCAPPAAGSSPPPDPALYPPPAHPPAAPIAVPRRARGSRERTPPLLKAYASVVGAGHADAVAALLSLVEVLWAQGKLADAETMLSKQLRLHEQLDGAAPREIGQGWVGLATLQWQRDAIADARASYGAADRGYDKSLVTMAKCVAGDERAELQCELASALAPTRSYCRRWTGRATPSPRWAARTSCTRSHSGAEHHFVGIGQHNMGLIHISLGDTAGALKSLERAVRICEYAIGLFHPDSRAALTSLRQLLDLATEGIPAHTRASSVGLLERAEGRLRVAAAERLQAAVREKKAGGGRRAGAFPPPPPRRGPRVGGGKPPMPTRPSFSKQQQLGRAPGLPGLRRGMSWSKAGGGGVASFSRRDSWSHTPVMMPSALSFARAAAAGAAAIAHSARRRAPPTPPPRGGSPLGRGGGGRRRRRSGVAPACARRRDGQFRAVPDAANVGRAAARPGAAPELFRSRPPPPPAPAPPATTKRCGAMTTRAVTSSMRVVAAGGDGPPAGAARRWRAPPPPRGSHSRRAAAAGASPRGRRWRRRGGGGAGGGGGGSGEEEAAEAPPPPPASQPAAGDVRGGGAARGGGRGAAAAREGLPPPPRRRGQCGAGRRRRRTGSGGAGGGARRRSVERTSADLLGDLLDDDFDDARRGWLGGGGGGAGDRAARRRRAPRRASPQRRGAGRRGG